MTLSFFNNKEVEITIQALIAANKEHYLGTGFTDGNAELGVTVVDGGKEFIVNFLVFLYPDAEEPQITDRVIFAKDIDYSKFIVDTIIYILDTYNEYDGYETKEDYLY